MTVCDMYTGFNVKDVGDIQFEEFPDDPTTASNVRNPRAVGAANKKVQIKLHTIIC